MRNNINYYGAALSIEEAQEAISDTEELMNFLFDKYLKQITKEIKEIK